MFELKYGWTGLLVEAHPFYYPLGLKVGRKAWAAPVCLGTERRPHFSPFLEEPEEGLMGGLVPDRVGVYDQEQGKVPTYKLQCYPLYSLLKAVGSPTVNLFSLDIEGAEYQVLRTVPWDKVDIEVLLIELVHVGLIFPGSKEDVVNYLDSVGYQFIMTVAKDDLFIRKDLLGSKYNVDVDQMKAFYDEHMKNSSDVKDEL